MALSKGLELRARLIADAGRANVPILHGEALRKLIYEEALKTMREVVAETRAGG